MRNIIISKESGHCLSTGFDSKDLSIIGLAHNHSSSITYVLYNTGKLFAFNTNGKGLNDGEDSLGEDIWRPLFSCTLEFPDEEPNQDWFYIEYISATSSVVCLSRQGMIATLTEDLNDEGILSYNEPECIGVMEGGLAAAAFSPDLIHLLLITNNDSLIMMTNSFEVLHEIDLPPRLPNTPASVSFRGDDGQLFSVATTDKYTGISRVRIYETSQCDQISFSQNPGMDTPEASIVRGIHPNVNSFAYNGSYIAIHQERVPGLKQIALLEKNGLRHGDFDLRLPYNPDEENMEWKVESLQWDLTSSFILVGWKLYNKKTNEVSFDSLGTIQIYYRDNYYWYMKQQWSSRGLSFLRFDSERVDRMFFQERLINSNNEDTCLIRVLDFNWNVGRSHSTRDGTVCVTDGSVLKLTPLGYNTVPPPMSMYQQELSLWGKKFSHSCPRMISFYESKNSKLENFPAVSMAILVDHSGSILFSELDKKGKPMKSYKSLNINTILSNLTGGSGLEYVHWRSVLVSEGENEVVVQVVGSSTVGHDLSAAASSGSNSLYYYKNENVEVDIGKNDIVIALKTNIDSFYSSLINTKDQITNDISNLFDEVRVLENFPGSILAIAPVQGNETEHSFALGIHTNLTNEFVIYRINSETWQWNSGDKVQLIDFNHKLESNTLSNIRVITTVPENCYSFTVLSLPSVEDKNEFSSDEASSHLVISLSHKNRLYCGELLIVSGASSYIFNTSYNILMFVSLGTHPHLHYITSQTLIEAQKSFLAGEGVDAMEGMEENVQFNENGELKEMNNNNSIWAFNECNIPRPVERGTQIITSVPHSSKVIVQMPRGNLEAFEPRPLVLLEAQRMIKDSNNFYQCLVMLRRQRVDLNFLIDYNPEFFFKSINTFVRETIRNNFDYLCLLISSLTQRDVMLKYNFYDVNSEELRKNRLEYIQANNFFGDVKINKVCSEIRSVLLEIHEESPENTSIINPVLCTFAKQLPPLYTEALTFIQNIASKNNKNSASLTTSAVKYLAYLSDSKLLFEAALAECDFTMAKVVARNCQMDPKVYLPLISGFQSIAEPYNNDLNHPAHNLMKIKVNLHLNLASKVVVLYHSYLTSLIDYQLNSNVNVDEFIKEGENLISQISKLIADNKLSSSLLDILNETEQKNNFFTSNTLPSLTLMMKFISEVRTIYADSVINVPGCYKQSVSAYLSTYPPNTYKAIQVLINNEDWPSAISLASRCLYNKKKDSSDSTTSLLYTPVSIAQDAVNKLIHNQQIGISSSSFNIHEDDEDEEVSSMTLNELIKQEDSDPQFLQFNKILYIANLAIEYCNDVESAVTILTNANYWNQALEICQKYDREDLADDIFSSARTTATSVKKLLKSRIQKLPSIVASLTETWKEPEERIKQVSTTDNDLFAQINERENEELQDINDTLSEFSALTKYTTASLRSTTSSIRSGTSTVSILSKISDKSTTSLLSESNQSQSSKSTSNFSIQGLDHSLLSRGTLNDYATKEVGRNPNGKVYKRDRTPRRQKRIERSRAKGYSKDVWKLKEEENNCQLLIKYLNIKTLTNIINSLTKFLLLSFKQSDFQLIRELQQIMQDFVKTLQSNPPPLAPLYPKEWLVLRNMSSVINFQDPRARYEEKLNRRLDLIPSSIDRKLVSLLTTQDYDELLSTKTWWSVAADGIKYWFNNKDLCLQLPEK